MRILLRDCRLVFERVPGTDSRSSLDLRGVEASIEASGSSIVVDQLREGSEYRWISKYNRTGEQVLRMLLDVRFYRTARVEIDEDNATYSIDCARRQCASPISLVFGTKDGEAVVLDPNHAPDATRNVYRFNSDGTLRWQIGPRDWRPNDSFWGAAVLPNGNVRARASINGWSAEVDDDTGRFLRVIATDER